MRYPRVIYRLIFGCFLVAVQSCNSQPKAKGAMVIESVEQATQAIEQYHGKAADFTLPISQDKNLTLHGEEASPDVTMAIITDQILKKGWMPNGFEEKDRVRYYRYSQ